MVKVNLNTLEAVTAGLKQSSHISFRGAVPKTNAMTSVIKSDMPNDIVVLSAKAQGIANSHLHTNQILLDLGDKNFLHKELFKMLSASRKNGEPKFTQLQTEIIKNAEKKMRALRTVSKKLEMEGKKQEKEVVSKVIDMFGGEEGYGKYLTGRVKDQNSIAAKLKNRLIDLTNDMFNNALAQKIYKKDFSKLSDAEQKMIKHLKPSEELTLTDKQLKQIRNLYAEDSSELMHSRTHVRDLIGVRLVLPKGSKAETEKATAYIEKAIQDGNIEVTRVSNYYGSEGVKPYIDNKRIANWSEMDGSINLIDYMKSKPNGYTTCQLNIGANCELQIRSRLMNVLGNLEHLYYDICENKDITKGVKELKEYYEKAGLFKEVEEIKNNPVLSNEYKRYLKDSYKRVRDIDLGSSKYPLDLGNYIDSKYCKNLSIEGLQELEKGAEKIKAKYPQLFHSKQTN